MDLKVSRGMPGRLCGECRQDTLTVVHVGDLVAAGHPAEGLREVWALLGDTLAVVCRGCGAVMVPVLMPNRDWDAINRMLDEHGA